MGAHSAQRFREGCEKRKKIRLGKGNSESLWGAELNGEQRIAVTVSQKDVMPVLEGYNADVAQRYHCKFHRPGESP